MRTTVFLLLGLILFFCSDAANNIRRKRPDIKRIAIDCSGYPTKACTDEYRPHCGVVRTTYANKCDFCNAYVESDGKLQLDYLGECIRPLKE